MTPQDQNTQTPCVLYAPQQASEYLLARYGIRRAPSTLNKLRVVGGGPAYRKVGTLRVAYDQHSLDDWATGLIGKPLRSTSEAA